MPTETDRTGGKTSQPGISISRNSLIRGLNLAILLIIMVFISTTQASDLPSLPYAGESVMRLSNLPALEVPIPRLAPGTAVIEPPRPVSQQRPDGSQADAPSHTPPTQRVPDEGTRPTIALEMVAPSDQTTTTHQAPPPRTIQATEVPPSAATPQVATPPPAAASSPSTVMPPFLTTPPPAARPQTLTPTPLHLEHATPSLSLPLDPVMTTALPIPETTADMDAEITAEEPPTVWHVQLLAGRSRDYVVQDKEAFIERYADMLDDLELYIADANPERRQGFYRLRVAEWQTEPSAWSWCSRLKQRGHDCFVARIILDED